MSGKRKNRRRLGNFKKAKPNQNWLPPVLQNIILGYMGEAPADTRNYSLADNICTLFDNRLPILALLQHVVRDELTQAEEMIKENPALLLEADTVETYAKDLEGKPVLVNGKPFELAIAADNVKYHPGEECMAEMIGRYLDLYHPGEKEKQYLKQFPPKDEKEELLQQQEDLRVLQKILTAIENASPQVCKLVLDYQIKPIDPSNLEAQTLLAALEEFRQYVKPKGVIRTGKHFKSELLVSAIDLCNQQINVGSWGGFNNPKSTLYVRRVCGYIERFASAPWARVLAQGLYDYVEKGKELCRDSFKYSEGAGSYFPLDSNPEFRLGVDCYLRVAAESGGGTQWSGRLHKHVDILKKYIKQKQQHGKELCKKTLPSPQASI